MTSSNSNSENFILLNRQAAKLEYFDFTLTLSRQLSSPQLQIIKSLFERKGFRLELVDKPTLSYYILFIAYDNVKEILKHAEKHRMLKKRQEKGSTMHDNSKKENLAMPRLRSFLRNKASQHLNSNIIELEQKQIFTVAKRYEFIKSIGSQPNISVTNDLRNDEPFEEFIDLFSQSELLRIFLGLIQSVEINTNDPAMISLFKIAKEDETSFTSHRLIDFLQRTELLEALTPLHTNDLQSSLKSIDSMSNYYGQNVSIYFQFMTFYIKYLTLPAVFGVLRQLIGFINPEASLLVFELDLLYCVMIIIWSTLFIRYWRQKSAEICLKSGSSGTGFVVSDNRYDFKGIIRVNPATELPEYWFPKSKKLWLYLKSSLFHFPLMMFSFFIMILFLNMLGYVDPSHWVYVRSLSSLSEKSAIFDKTTARANIPTIFQSLSMVILSTINKKLAYKTTNWENHKTNTQYNNTIIFKRFLFEIINTFTHLLYIAFWRLELQALQAELIALYTTDEIRRLVFESLIPYFKSKRSASTLKKRSKDEMYSPEHYIEEKLIEIQLPIYDSYDDYLEMIIQFGYITLFAGAFPLSGIFSLMFNVLETTSDAFKLKYAYRRPIPRLVNGIGSWQSWINFMSHISLMTNTILIAYSSLLKKAVGDELFPNDECEQYKLLVLVFLLEHAIFVINYILRKRIRTEPKWISIYRQRNK